MSQEKGGAERHRSQRGILVVCAMLLFALAFTVGGLLCLRRVLSSRPSPGGPREETTKTTGKEKPAPTASDGAQGRK